MRSARANASIYRRLMLFGTALMLALGVGLVVSGTPVSAQENPIAGTIWVANEYGSSISVIEAATNEVITTLTGVAGPHNIQAAPDGSSVWVVSQNALVAKIDAQSYSLLGTAPTGDHPAHVILTPDGATAYVTNGGDDSVTALDSETMAVIATIPVGASPHGARPSPDGRWIYVANAGGTTVSVIDTALNLQTAEIEVGERPVQVAFSPDGVFAYVSLNGLNALGKVDVESHTLIDTVEVGVGPIQVFVTPGDEYVLVANQGTESSPSTTVSIVDTETFAVVNTLETGAGAHGVVVDPSGKYAYVSNIYADSVTVIDLTTLEVTGAIPVGSGPNGISFLSMPAPTPLAREIDLELAQVPAEASDHEAHHPAADVTPTAVPEVADSGMMDEMAPGGMDMMTMMQNMRSMMDTMMKDMEMSGDMHAMMETMRSMMDMMMSGDMMPGMGMMRPTEVPDTMPGMEMDTGYSVDDLAPLALGYYAGGEVYFVHPESSDEGVSAVLTAMMGPEVITVPELAEIPEYLLGDVYVFTNGVEGMGPLGYQPDVFDSVPGDESYTPLRAVHLVNWQENAPARELTSAAEIVEAEANGEITIERPGVVVNMPILVWPNGQR